MHESLSAKNRKNCIYDSFLGFEKRYFLTSIFHSKLLIVLNQTAFAIKFRPCSVILVGVFFAFIRFLDQATASSFQIAEMHSGKFKHFSTWTSPDPNLLQILLSLEPWRNSRSISSLLSSSIAQTTQNNTHTSAELPLFKLLITLLWAQNYYKKCENLLVSFRKQAYGYLEALSLIHI